MPRHLRLLVFDLDYVVFDCALLKVRALRQSLISFAESIPQSTRLPDVVDVEETFRQHGFRWLQFLEIGLDEEKLAELQQAYAIHQERLIETGAGRIYSGVVELLTQCRREGLSMALGADATRDYLLAVSDRFGMHGLFDTALCTEEFGVGGTREMLEELMHQGDVNPSETLVLGTRGAAFDAAHDLDILTVGCGWGLQKHDGLPEADVQALTVTRLLPAIQQADEIADRYGT